MAIQSTSQGKLQTPLAPPTQAKRNKHVQNMDNVALACILPDPPSSPSPCSLPSPFPLHVQPQVFSQIDTLLQEVGSSKNHILHVLVHLKSIQDGLGEFNAAWRAWFGEGVDAHLPVCDYV